VPPEIGAPDDSPSPAIAIEGLSKTYGSLKALDDVSFQAPSGAVTALLGLNGAGKTTLFQILTGLFVADSGRALIRGADIGREPVRALRELGIVFQQQVLDLDLTVVQNLRFYAGLHGLRGAPARTAIYAALARFRVSDVAEKRARDLSGGTRRKVELARSLVTQPRVLVLDEPSQGLDTQSRADLVRDIFGLCVASGTSVLWATHLVAEVESAQHAVVLDRGQVVAQGHPRLLMEATGAPTLERAFLSLVRRSAAES
jgi:ABC-2 type transport system ATP-binding protein